MHVYGYVLRGNTGCVMTVIVVEMPSQPAMTQFTRCRSQFDGNGCFGQGVWWLSQTCMWRWVMMRRELVAEASADATAHAPARRSDVQPLCPLGISVLVRVGSLSEAFENLTRTSPTYSANATSELAERWFTLGAMGALCGHVDYCAKQAGLIRDNLARAALFAGIAYGLHEKEVAAGTARTEGDQTKESPGVPRQEQQGKPQADGRGGPADGK